MDRMPPPDLPDDPVSAVPVFTSRRKAERLPPLTEAPRSKAFDLSWCRSLARADWMSGFRWGVVSAVGGLAVFAIVAVEVLK